MLPIPVADDGQPRQSRPTVYSVPRRYDLATLFIISLAYAILLGTMRLVGASPVTSGHVAGFITWVGIGQALFFRGKRPRLASVAAGAVYLPLAAVIWRVILKAQANNVVIADEIEFAVRAAYCLVIGGAIYGYFAGVLVGAVFLFADLARRCFRRIRGG